MAKSLGLMHRTAVPELLSLWVEDRSRTALRRGREYEYPFYLSTVGRFGELGEHRAYTAHAR